MVRDLTSRIPGRSASSRIPAWTGSVAMGAAAAIWVAAVIVGGGLAQVTGQRPQLQVILVVLVAIDLLVAWKGRRGRVGLAILLWVFVRSVAAAGGLIVAALPAYAVAMLAWTTAPRRLATTAAWHPYQPAATAWRDDIVPPPLQKNLAGAHANASVLCLTCGAGPDSPRHQPPEDAAAS